MLIIACTTLAQIPQMTPIVRHNYGVIFSPQIMLENTHSVCHHTFAYQLNLRPVPNITTMCSTNSGMPRRNARLTLILEEDFWPAFRGYSDRIEKLVKQVKLLERNMDMIMPKNSRIRRGLIDAIGKIAKSLLEYT